MTLNDFYKQLEKSRKDLKWRLMDSKIRCNNPITNIAMCPLTGVLYLKNDKIHCLMNFDLAGRELHLDCEDVKTIAISSDYQHSLVNNHYWSEEVRNNILTAVGLHTRVIK